jgi:hypothetical protein
MPVAMLTPFLFTGEMQVLPMPRVLTILGIVATRVFITLATMPPPQPSVTVQDSPTTSLPAKIQIMVFLKRERLEIVF